MKKVIWVFGESATGKKTLIENIMNNKDNIRDNFNLNNKGISVVNETINPNNSSYDDKENELIRKTAILNNIKEFIGDDNDILFIKGQTNDMDDRYGNTLKTFVELFPNIEKEIYLLEVSDLDLLYERIKNKDWFKADYEGYSKMFPREWVDLAISSFKEKIEKQRNYGFKITEIDSTDGYKIVGDKKWVR